ncbi:MAG: hypothetical protein FWF95_04880 [Syntrophorhabdaceae bacterium]|nr:hypothetical protein [Syntrophorhabdaceae bacterium]
MQRMAEELKAIGKKAAVRQSIVILLIAAFTCIFFSFDLPVFLSAHRQLIAYITCALAAISLAITWKDAEKNSLLKEIEKICKTTSNPGATMARLEETWRDGLDLKPGRIDKEYIIYLNGTILKIIPLKNVVWVYDEISDDKYGYVYLFVCFDNNKYQSINFFNHDAPDMILNYISENCPDIATGHETEIEKLYDNKDMDGVRKYARAKRNRI